jgi:hypothetical protein
VAVSDLNQDGRLDLAAIDDASNTVSVLLGQGDGTFADHGGYVAGSSAYSVAVGDLNADGNPDLAVTGFESGTISVLPGQGDGSFADKTDYPIEGSPSSVAIGDLDGDGKNDLAVVNETTVSVLLAQADGFMATKVDYPIRSVENPWGPTRSIAIGDLNRDGMLDLVVANASSVSVLRGQGRGTFAARVDYATSPTGGPGTRNSVAIADLNGDAAPDLVVTSYPLNVLFGRGNGSFAAFAPYPGWADSLAISDLNGDARLDLVLAEGVGVRVLLNSCLDAPGG